MSAGLDVLADTVAIEPWFAAMDVTHIDKTGKRRIFRSTITADDQHMFGCHGDGNGIVERSRSGIGMPVDGIDADTGSGYDGLDETHVLDGIITDGDVRVQLTSYAATSWLKVSSDMCLSSSTTAKPP